MKKFIFFFFSLFLSVFLTNCEGTVDLRLEVSEIKGVADVDIDHNEGTIKFSVANDVSTFNLKDIIVPGSVKVYAFQDAGYTTMLGETLNLNVGENVFYLSLSSMVMTEGYTMYITRLSNEAKSPKSLSVQYLDETYSINESLSQGALLVTYVDDTSEVINITSSMVSNFDTSSYGEKTAIITYEGLVTEFTYHVVSNIKGIMVSESWVHDYLVGANEIYPNGVLIVSLEDDSIVEVKITKNMIVRFDTSTAGPKEMVLKYKNQYTKYSYVVHDGYSSVTIENLKETYNYGEKLKGNIKFVLGDYVFTEPLRDFAQGYDPYKYGTQTVTVPAYNLVVTVTVVENQGAENFEVPTPSTIKVDDLKEFYAIVCAIEDSERFQGEKYEYAYQYYLEEFEEEKEYIEEESLDVFRIAGITKEQIDQLISIYKTKLVSILDSYAQDYDRRHTDLYTIITKVTVNEISVIQDVLTDVMGIVSPNQITMLINETTSLNNSAVQYFSNPVVKEDYTVEYHTRDEYYGLLQAAGLTKVVNFLEKIENVTINVEMSLGSINYVVERAYTLMDAFVEINAQDVFDLKEYICSFKDKDIDTLDRKELLTMLHKAADVAKKLVIDTNLINDARDFVVDICTNVLVNGNGYNDYYAYVSLFELISLYGEDVVSIAKKLSSSELDTIMDLILSADSDMTKAEIAKCIVDIAKIAKPIITKLNSNEEAKEYVAYLFSYDASDKNVYSFISKAVTWTALDSNNLSESKIKEINDSFDALVNGVDYIDVSRRYYDVIVQKNSSIDHLLEKLNEMYKLYYIDSSNNRTPIQLTSNSVKGLDTQTKGWHTVTVSQQGTTVKLFYYVYDLSEENAVITHLDNTYYFDQYLLYFEKGTKTPNNIVIDKDSIDNDYWGGSNDVESIISSMYYVAFLEESYCETREYLDYSKVDFEVDTSFSGLKFGYLKYESNIGDILIPFQCYVYDENNPAIKAENKEIYVQQYNSYYSEEYVSIDYGRTNKQIAIELNSEDTQKPGTITKVFEGVEFTFVVLEEKVYNQIKEFDSFRITIDESDPENSYKISEWYVWFDRYSGYSGYASDYEDFMYELRYMYDNPSLEFHWDTYVQEDNYSYGTVNYTICDGSVVIYEGVASVEAVVHENFNDYDYYIYDNYGYSIIVDSYDEITTKLLLENLEVCRDYRYLCKSDEYLTIEELLKEATVSFYVSEEYEY